MGMKKTISLKTEFWKFLVMLIAGLFGAIIIPCIILWTGISFGLATYADYSEQATKNIVSVIAATPDLTSVTLPAGCKFLRLDKSYRIIETTLEGDDLDRAMEYAKSGEINGSLNKQYLFVTRDEEYIILQYYIGSQFTNDWMNEHLPSPEILLYLVIGLNCIIVCIVLTARFAKKLRVQLTPLFEATGEVAKQNLDFEVGHSKIKEFEDVLVSFSDMKDNLKISLEQQWRTELEQKEQIAALAHDLKTPLTVIQGNADLITETSLDAEQKLYADYIVESSDQMQTYIQMLIDISRAAVGDQIHVEDIDVSEFMQQISRYIESLCQTKGIRLQMSMTSLPQSLQFDKLLIERAIMNVVNNALDYSPQNGTIYVEVHSEEPFVEISITDEGIGFSKEALQHARERFFMEDQSRTSNMHFGMGLYITNSILEQHNGKLILENSKETDGAKVIIKIPDCQDK